MRSSLVSVQWLYFETELTDIVVLRNPAYFVLLICAGIALYVTYILNLWGPILQMTNAASAQALEEGKKRLREFLENSETGRQALAYEGRKGINGSPGADAEEIELDEL